MRLVALPRGAVSAEATENYFGYFDRSGWVHTVFISAHAMFRNAHCGLTRKARKARKACKATELLPLGFYLGHIHLYCSLC